MNKFINKIAVAMVGIAMAVGVGVAVGGNADVKKVDARNEKVAEAVFNSTNNESVGSYTKTWTNTTSDFEWTITNFNNNNNGWDNMIKCGRKNDPSTASIQTAAAVNEIITSVEINLSAINTTYTTSIKLYGGSNATEEIGSFEEKTGTQSVSIPQNKQAINQKYKIEFVCTDPNNASGVSNGFNVLTSVVLYKTVEDSAPAITIDDADTPAIVNSSQPVNVTATTENWNGSIAWSASPSTGVTISDANEGVNVSVANSVALGTVIEISATINSGQTSAPTTRKLVVSSNSGLSENTAFEADESVSLVRYGFTNAQTTYWVKGFVKTTSGASYYNTYLTTSRNNSGQQNTNCMYLYGPTAGTGVSLSDLAAGKIVTASGTLIYYNNSQPEMNPGTIKSIEEVTLSSVSVSGTPITQYAGMNFVPTNLTFEAVYSDDSRESIEGASITWPELTETGNNQTVTGTYQGLDVVVSGVSVVEDSYDTLTLAGDLSTTSFTTTSSWSASGLTVSANYVGKGDTDVTSSVTEWVFDPETPSEMGATASGSLKITAKIGELSSNQVTKTVEVIDISWTNSDYPDGSEYILASTGTATWNKESHSWDTEFNGVNNTSGLGTTVDHTAYYSCSRLITVEYGVAQNTFYLSYLENASKLYLTYNGSTKRLLSTDSKASATIWNITKGSNNVATIADSSSTSWKLLFNPNSGDYRFACYNSAQKDVMLIPATEEVKLQGRAEQFIQAYMHTEIATSDETKGTSCYGTDGTDGYFGIAKAALTKTKEQGGYSDCAVQFATSGDMWTRYVTWGAACGVIVTYSNSTISYSSNVGFNLPVISGDSSSVAMIITMISLVSVTAIGGFFFIRKKKIIK